MSEDQPNIEFGPPPIESEWVLLTGKTGRGKTLFMTGLLHERVKDLLVSGEKVFVISNYDIMNLPEGVEFFKSGSVRHIMERMVTASEAGISILVCIDEIDKTLNSNQSASNASRWLTTLASNARKFGVRSFYFSTQGRKSSDYRLRVNVSYWVLPTTECSPRGEPTAYIWDDPNSWERDMQQPFKHYEEAALIMLDDPLPVHKRNYNTREIIPIDLSPTIHESELPELVPLFQKWCDEKSIKLKDNKRVDVKSFIKRWNTSSFLIPYSPSGELVLFTELVRLDLIEAGKKDEIPAGEGVTEKRERKKKSQ